MDRLGEKPGRAEVLAGWLYHDRRLVRDVADTGGEDGDHSRRMGKKTRERVGAIATADGGLRLEVSGVRLLVVHGCRRSVWYRGRAGCGLRHRWSTLSRVLLKPPTRGETGRLGNEGMPPPTVPVG